MISPSQRPLPNNTQHSQQTNIHAPGGIRTHNPSRRAAKDLRLRPRGHWDRLSNPLLINNPSYWALCSSANDYDVRYTINKLTVIQWHWRFVSYTHHTLSRSKNQAGECFRQCRRRDLNRVPKSKIQSIKSDLNVTLTAWYFLKYGY